MTSHPLRVIFPALRPKAKVGRILFFFSLVNSLLESSNLEGSALLSEKELKLSSLRMKEPETERWVQTEERASYWAATIQQQGVPAGAAGVRHTAVSWECLSSELPPMHRTHYLLCCPTIWACWCFCTMHSGSCVVWASGIWGRFSEETFYSDPTFLDRGVTPELWEKLCYACRPVRFSVLILWSLIVAPTSSSSYKFDSSPFFLWSAPKMVALFLHLLSQSGNLKTWSQAASRYNLLALMRANTGPPASPTVCLVLLHLLHGTSTGVISPWLKTTFRNTLNMCREYTLIKQTEDISMSMFISRLTIIIITLLIQ